MGIADLPPGEFARVFARLLAPAGAPIRPEDARWIEDVDYIAATREKNLRDLSDDELLELLRAQLRAADRSTAHERELSAILQAKQVLSSQRGPGSTAVEGSCEPSRPAATG